MTTVSGLTKIWCAAVLTLSFAATARADVPEPAQSGNDSHQHQNQQKPKPPQVPHVDPGQQGHEGHAPAPEQKLPPDLPPITDEDRRAAFPDVDGHTVHDTAIHYFVLFDELEWQGGADSNGLKIETNGWIGGEVKRFWFRVDGETEDGDVQQAQVHALYGRAIARWWEVVAGVRHDMRPGPAQTWAAVGIQGLAPYWFEVEATGYVGESGRTHLRLEAEYELLLTNRLILQPVAELDLYGKDIPESGIGAGFSSTEAGLRLRYELRREFAPYVGVSWNWKHGGTADFARADGADVSGARLAVGVRMWF